MDRAEFDRLAEIYGGDVQRWPAEMVDGATALLAQDPGAAAQLDAEARLDRALTIEAPAPRPEMFAAMMANFDAVTQERREAEAAARVETVAMRVRRLVRVALGEVRATVHEAAESIGGRRALAGGVGAAAAAGLMIGMISFSANVTPSLGGGATTTASAEDDSSFDVVNVEVWFINDEI